MGSLYLYGTLRLAKLVEDFSHIHKIEVTYGDGGVGTILNITFVPGFSYGLCESGRLKEVVYLFEEMVSKEQILPDALTYNVLINGFYRARKMIEFMRKNGCNPIVFNDSTLMNGFCKEKKLLETKEVFDEMKSFRLKPNTISYPTLINCFYRVGKIDEATELLKEMKEKSEIRGKVKGKNCNQMENGVFYFL
ncbi:hypothetical protein F2P56_030988 [Juglans regia]|uniref:Uncharacterized protein n=1 Tax=Juglans regia TaxID=51240 RepID=A0A833U2W0_JUGRE|nr:hypothetical protein F2P56_030988 [Juglans regia]